MPRDRIYAIVEGRGEADPPEKGEESAVKVLIRKMLHDLQCWNLHPPPRNVWRMYSCGDFFTPVKLERVIRAHKEFDDCAAILVLVDMDDDCPKEEAPKLAARIRSMETLPFSVVVVCAKREYESWFLASLETIHAGHTYANEPEKRRDAKGWLKEKFGYKETADQATYTRLLNITLTQKRSRSFRRLYHAFEELVTAVADGRTIVTPE